MYRIDSLIDEPVSQDAEMLHRIVRVEDDVIICASHSLAHVEMVLNALTHG